MAEKATLARPYAKAAFEHARTEGATGNALAAWSEALMASATVIADERVQNLLDSPRVTPAQLVDFIAEVLGSRLDAGSRNFVATLAENRRLALLPEIAAQFEELRADAESIADVQITSAVALTDAQQQRLQSALQKRLKRTVRLHCSVDASLVGGAIVKTGDLVIDGSLQSQLARLTAQMTH